MNQPLDSGRLREIRRALKLSQKELADRAGLSKETIYRLERGRQPGNRKKTYEGLARALRIDPGVLTGELPAPIQDHENPGVLSFHAMNYRVTSSVRNAFALVAARYQIPVARVLEIAPLLFVLAAEASLKRRSEKITELEALVEREKALRQDLQHLSLTAIPSDVVQGIAQAERTSIELRDIFGAQIPTEFAAHSYYRDSVDGETNPFVLSLRDAAKHCGDTAVVEMIDRDDMFFMVCQEVALKIAAWNHDLADAILDGRIILYKMPRHLHDETAVELRVAWLRDQLDAFPREVSEEVGVQVNPVLGEGASP
jgi:transcriptional regulator with XRE-family HTH domain